VNTNNFKIKIKKVLPALFQENGKSTGIIGFTELGIKGTSSQCQSQI
jgi:hypothetical protein